MTLEQLGATAGVGYKHVAEIERGTKVPSFEAIGRLAQALHIDAYELFLPDTLCGSTPDQNLRVLMREIDKHGTSAKKRFLACVLAAAREI